MRLRSIFVVAIMMTATPVMYIGARLLFNETTSTPLDSVYIASLPRRDLFIAYIECKSGDDIDYIDLDVTTSDADMSDARELLSFLSPSQISTKHVNSINGNEIYYVVQWSMDPIRIKAHVEGTEIYFSIDNDPWVYTSQKGGEFLSRLLKIKKRRSQVGQAVPDRSSGESHE